MKAARKQESENVTSYEYMLNWLPQEWVPYEVIESLHGIRLGDDQRLQGAILAWTSRLRRPQNPFQPGKVNRHSFESYLQQSGLLPLKLAAGHLGMALDSFKAVMVELENRNLLTDKMVKVSEQVVPESLVRSFPELFPGLRFKIFQTFSGFCSSLHRAIKNDLKVNVNAIRCVTSKYRGEKPPDFGYEYDCLTGDPIGLRYQVWLNFKKPFHLRPDACSMLLYAQHEKELKKWVFPDVQIKLPPGLK